VGDGVDEVVVFMIKSDLLVNNFTLQFLEKVNKIVYNLDIIKKSVRFQKIKEEGQLFCNQPVGGSSPFTSSLKP